MIQINCSHLLPSILVITSSTLIGGLFFIARIILIVFLLKLAIELCKNSSNQTVHNSLQKLYNHKFKKYIIIFSLFIECFYHLQPIILIIGIFLLMEAVKR